MNEPERPNARDEPSRWGKVPEGRIERRYLAGTRGLLPELVRAVAIGTEFLRGARAFRKLGPCDTVFGSARFDASHRYYELARATGRALAEAGFAVMTGGGPGVMEAANRGAREAGGVSVGCNIHLPHEQEPNPFLDQWVTFEHFFVRKVIMVKQSIAFIVLPGGFGTLDEVFETVTLVQTKKITRFPVVLMGDGYWSQLRQFLDGAMVGEGTIDEEEIDILSRVESPAQAIEEIRRASGR